MKPLNNISSALNLFIESAKEHTLATEEGNYRKGNKNYYLIVEAISYLRNNNSLTELKPLLNNSYIGVRLWTACYLLPVFEKEQIYSKIPNKINNDIVAVYFDYDGDYNEPFSYMIGCEVTDGTEAPEGLRKVTISKANYRKFLAKGKMPDCIGEVWYKIWDTKLDRAYTFDFEIYGEKSQNWDNAEVEVFIGVK